MIIQSWIIVGLIAGCLVGMFAGRRYGMVGDILSGFIGGLVGGTLAALLFVVAGAVNGSNTFAAILAFTGAVILLAMKRVVTRSNRPSA